MTHRSANQFPSYQQPQPGMQQEQPKKKRKGWKIALAVIAILAVIGIFAPTGEEDSTTAAQSDEATTATLPAPGEDLSSQTDAEAPSGPAPTETAPEPTQTEEAPAPEKQSGHTLRFEASTSDGSTGMVTYVAEDMNIVQHSDIPMPWSEEITGISSSWDVIGANVSIQQNGSGEVSCRVLWDGEVVSENTSTGPFSIASCSLPSSL